VTASPFAAWLDDWSLRGMDSYWLPLELFARQDETVIHLELASERPIVLQGDAGFSQKHSSGGGSHYYSQPFLTASGYLRWDDDVFQVSGEAWLDREWSSQFLQKGQQGWDWFALHLDSGEKLMLFQLREPPADGEDRNFRHGVLIAPGGRTRTLDPSGIALEVREIERVAGRSLPLAWRIELPAIDRQIEVRALHPEQWMDVDFPYWEGAVTVSGDGPENRGVGYMELTGYPPD
jgi:predicted secreted hydrolase